MTIFAWPWRILPPNLVQTSISNPELLTFFRNSTWRPPPSWIFKLSKFCTFVMFTMWCLSSIRHLVRTDVGYKHWDRRHFVSGIYLMTSRGRLRTALMHLAIKFSADIFVQFWVIGIFPKFKMAAAAISDFQAKWIWHISSYLYLGALALCQIWFKYLL